MDHPDHIPEEVSVRQAHESSKGETLLIDIRSDRERMVGSPAGAIAHSREAVFTQCRESSIAAGLLICDSGSRSLKLVRELNIQGYTGFSSVAGGYKAWRDAGLPVTSAQGLSAQQSERYARHLVMPQVGPAGQRKLLATRILLVGLGGLNSPAALYLAAAGVGHLGLLDFDRVERSNLQRQVLHEESSLGQLKAESACRKIDGLNPEVRSEVINCRIDEKNADDLVQAWDLVIDGTDNFETRYALNDACVRHEKPLVYGAVMRFQGQVSAFRGAPCFRCLMPRPPAAGEAPGCAEAGVLGVLPGIVGTLQATEALKIVLGLGTPLFGRLLMLDALTMDFRHTRIHPDPDCPVCA